MIKKILQIRKNSDRIDLFLRNKGFLQKFNSVQISFFTYALSQKQNSGSFKFLPYEEYITDLSNGFQSSYEKVDSNAGKIFGIFLGLILAVIFYIINPDLLISVEAIVSIFGVYTIAKEIWNDIDLLLQNLTQSTFFRWMDTLFNYRKLNFGTIQSLWEDARKIRYKGEFLLAERLNFIEHSNSKTIDLEFKSKSFKTEDEELQILKINLDEKVENFGNYSFGLKITLVKSFLFINLNDEYFQIWNGNNIGLYSKEDVFIDNSILRKKVFVFSRLKYYLKSEHIEEIMIDIK